MRPAFRAAQCHSAEHVQRALRTEQLLGDAEILVVPDGEGLCLCGRVTRPEQRALAERLARKLAPSLRVRSRLEVRRR